MADPMVDQMTRMKLRVLEKRLENEKEGHNERGDSALSTRSYDRQTEALHSALRRKRDLLRRLKEQHMLDYIRRPQTWPGTHLQHHYDFFPTPAPTAPPVYMYQSPPPAPIAPLLAPPAPQPPQIMQHTVPQPPAPIIQQLPQQQPLIAQIPQIQPASYRSGSIKEDMVELMLMQNAQMHQIIMHSLMLNALPPIATNAWSPHSAQGGYMKSKSSPIHHHHCGAPLHPPIGHAAWPTTVPVGRGAYHPSTEHTTDPVTLPPLNTVTVDGLKTKVPHGALFPPSASVTK